MLFFRISCTFFLLLIFQCSWSQSSVCIKGTITIYKQSQIDNFAVEYPGCTSIDGNLEIQEFYEGVILNLEGFSQLKKIGGQLRITSNAALTNLKGLENLDTVTRGIFLHRNPALTDISALSQIKELGRINITENKTLEQIDTFLFIDTLQYLIIRGNPRLQNLSGFGNVHHVHYECIFSDNQSLTSMEGLGHLRTPIRHLAIEENNSLESLHGLSQLAQTAGLVITRNPKLVNFSGLDGIITVNGLWVEDNAMLNSIEALNNIIPDSLRYITIRNNPQLTICHIEPICQRFLSAEDPIIESNGTGCNSPLELIQACDLNSSCPQDLILKTQSDVDNFAGIYAGCDSIYGDLIIENSTITNLAGLAQIKYIGGEILIRYNESLVSIAGLNGIHSINNGFDFYGNHAIKTLEGLPPFDKITGNLYIINNDSLSSIEIFGDLQSVSGNLTIGSLPDLPGLQGLNNLQKVGGSLVLSGLNIQDLSSLSQLDTVNGGVTIKQCPLLQDLDGLTDLKFIKGLFITGNNSLEYINGLSQIQEITGKIQITDNPSLFSLSGLTSLQYVGDEIIISGNSKLQDLNAFQQLTTAHGISLKNNPQLRDLSAFQQLQFNHGNLIINSMPRLGNLHGLEQLHSIDGILEISSNDSLNSLQGLEQLNRIGSYLTLKNNPQLISIDGIGSLDSIGGKFTIENCRMNSIEVNGIVSIQGELSFLHNSNLTEVSGFNNITKLGGFIIINNPKLSLITGFNNLNKLFGKFEIKNNNLLSILPEFSQLTVIYSNVELFQNIQLTSVKFLENIESTGPIEIYNCSIDSLLCRQLKRIEGSFNISNCSYLETIYMDSLSHIAGDLRIVGNSQLEHLGFQSMVETGGDITISYNDSLEDIEGLSSLQRFNGRLYITNNDNLKTIEGLRNVERSSFYVPDEYLFQHLFTIEDNPNLSTCAILPICEILDDPSSVYYLSNNHRGCNNKADLQANCGLPNSCISDSIKFETQTSIDLFPATYPGCTFIQGSLIVAESISGNIIRLDSLAQINKIGGDLVIRNNSLITSLSGLDSLTDLGGSLVVQSNESLISLMQLRNLIPHDDIKTAASIKEFTLTNNPKLTSCSIPFVCSTLTDPYKSYSLSSNLNGCNTVSEIQEVCDYPTECELGYASRQSVLEEFRIRFPKCVHITDNISLSAAVDAVVDLSPLSLIESVDGGLFIHSQTQLTSLTGLNNLRRLNGPLDVTSNAKLEDISALSQLDASTVKKSSFHLELSDNPKLSECAIESICHLVENFEVTTKITNNGNTCKTREEILQECTVGILSPDKNMEILIYPNPAQDRIHIESASDLQQDIISVGIADMNGRMLSMSSFASTVDVSHLPSGLYVIIFLSRQYGTLAHRILIAQ